MSIEILIVADDLEYGETILTILADHNYKVTTKSSLDAISYLENNQPTIIIVDDFQQNRIRYSPARTIFMRSVPRANDSKRADGITFLQKPFSLDNLLDTVERKINEILLAR